MEPAAARRRADVDAQDAFSLSYFAWVALVCLLFAAANDLDRLFNLYLLLVPLLVLPALAVTIYWIVALVRNAVLRRWRRVVSVLAAPVAAFLLLVGASAAGITPEWIRFEIGKPYYTGQIAKLAQTDEPRFKMFDWGQTGGAGVTNVIYTLIYDESDEISRPQGERSKAWQGRASKLCPGTMMCALLKPTPSELSITVTRMEGHFYLVTEVF